jgi:hypothetical protein
VEIRHRRAPLVRRQIWTARVDGISGVRIDTRGTPCRSSVIGKVARLLFVVTRLVALPYTQCMGRLRRVRLWPADSYVADDCHRSSPAVAAFFSRRAGV